jgi:nicotinamidase-related amidase
MFIIKKTLTAIGLFAAFSTSVQAGADLTTTALLITDPQNDFLHEKGKAYGLVKDNIAKLGTIDNIEALFKTAKQKGVAVFVSPHQYFPHDSRWQHRGALQQTMQDIEMFATSKKSFEGSGADFLSQYKTYINDGKTTISSPHKVYGPESNDLVLQLRKRGIQKVLLGGLAANLCTDSHMRELIEQGFEVLVINDAVGAPGDEAYAAALTNYGMIANAVIDTREALRLMTSQ